MRQMEFGNNWCKWILVPFSSSSYSILVKSESVGLCEQKRGLVQALFNLVMEVLDLLVEKEDKGGLN